MGNLGTIYLIEVIMYLSSKENYLEYMRNLEKSTYTVIAQKLNVNLETLKSSIRKASATANNISNNKEVNMFLTPKNVAGYVLEKII